MRGVVIVVVLFGVIAATLAGDRHENPAKAAPTQPSPEVRAALHYTARQRLLVQAMDAAAGKAMQASVAPTGEYGGRTAQDWCGVVANAEADLVGDHSLAWADRVDRSDDPISRRFQQAAKTCG